MKTKSFLSCLLLLATCLVGSSVFCSCSKDDVEETPPATVTPPGGNTTEEKDTHEYVDLGLPSGTLWATCNVGALRPEFQGYLFAWGEIEPKTTYNWSTYKYCDGSYKTMTKYCTSSYYGIVDGKIELESSDDAATANWGSNWQIPCYEQFKELLDGFNTTTSWTTLNGVKGRRITSRSNGHSIFLPAAGRRYDTSLSDAGSEGNYWSRSVSTIENYAYGLNLYSNGIRTVSGSRYYGMSVRPVRVKKNKESVVMVTNIELLKDKPYLYLKDFTYLTSIVLPWYATNKNVKWYSSNNRIATVNQAGKVAAVAVGTCTITCSATDGSGVWAQCEVTVRDDSSGTLDGHDYVDLGLPSGILWATCNVGASKPEEYGDYFAWGETEPKTTYNWSTYKYCKGTYDTMTKYCTNSYYGIVDGKRKLEPSDDAAIANWGADWHMPSDGQFYELVDREYTISTWTTMNGKYGIKITSKSNGNSIFLPAAGYRGGTSLHDVGSDGNYVSNSLNPWGCIYASCLSFDSSTVRANYDVYSTRCVGWSVRPVRVKK